MLTQDQIDAIPGQPDGIEDDSRDMPDPARAAGRILTYVETFGDGLYSVASDGSPLYGRDLCSVAQAVKKLLAELDQLRGQYDTLLEDAERFRALARSMADERDRLRVQASQSDADHRVMDARATELERLQAGPWRGYSVEAWGEPPYETSGALHPTDPNPDVGP
jgi:hypothetical protein